jgi:uncharacterized protein
MKLGAARPLVGVVHLPPSLGYAGFPGVEEALAIVRRDVAALCDAGYDGVLLENDADKPHDLYVGKHVVAWLARAAAEARAIVRAPLGIGVQRVDWEASLAVAAAVGLDFVRLDVFVDRVRMQGSEVAIDSAAVVAQRRALGIERVALWTDVHVKHAELVSVEPLQASVRRAIACGSDAVLVTGERTGMPPAIEDLRAAAEAASSVPVVIGSGLTPELAPELAPLCGAALVGTAIHRERRIDPERAARMLQAWRAA